MKKLLMADDESGVRSLVRMTFESDAYEILEASDGNQALKLAREHQPDLVLLDVTMPGMSGFDVCRSLKEDPETQQIKVIMPTARAQQMDMEEGQKSGADDYFTKPFSPVALMKKVEEMFGANKL
jgi:two-component system, OmpR family, phosphate regulon response regulator PhoB